MRFEEAWMNRFRRTVSVTLLVLTSLILAVKLFRIGGLYRELCWQQP